MTALNLFKKVKTEGALPYSSIKPGLLYYPNQVETKTYIQTKQNKQTNCGPTPHPQGTQT